MTPFCSLVLGGVGAATGAATGDVGAADPVSWTGDPAAADPEGDPDASAASGPEEDGPAVPGEARLASGVGRSTCTACLSAVSSWAPGAGAGCHVGPSGWCGWRVGEWMRVPAGGPAAGVDPEADRLAPPVIPGFGTWVDPEADCIAGGGDPEADTPDGSVHIK